MTADVQIALPAWLARPETFRRSLLEGAQRAMTNTLVKHFRAKDRAEPNAQGWARSHWWNRVASSVTSRIEGESAVADIREPGVRLRWLGGTVKPKAGKKALAIPADPSVRGTWPSEYAGKGGTEKPFPVWQKGAKTGFLAIRGSDPEHPRILWWLVGATHHEADPSVVPETALVEGVAKAAQAVCKVLAKGGAA